MLLEFALQTVRDGKLRVTRKRESKEVIGREDAPRGILEDYRP